MRARVGALIVALALTACTASREADLGGVVPPAATGTPTGPTPTGPTEPSGPTRSEAPQATEAPATGQCRDYGLDALPQAVNDAPLVDCGDEHTSYTYYVGELSAADNDTLVDEGVAQCLPAFRQALDWSARDYGGSLATYVFFRPGDQAWESGERWLRCDLVAASANALLPLPADVERLADDSRGGRYAQCLTVAGRATECSESHAYTYAGSFPVRQHRQPSERRLLALAGKRCPDLTGGDGWYASWPGTVTWTAGDRIVWCWAPSGSSV